MNMTSHEVQWPAADPAWKTAASLHRKSPGLSSPLWEKGEEALEGRADKIRFLMLCCGFKRSPPTSRSFTKHVLFTFSPHETIYSGALSLTVPIKGVFRKFSIYSEF